MQALLVDAFPETEQGRKAFRAYRGAIEKSFRPFSSLDVRPVQFHIRRVEELGEFVYDAKQRSARPTEGLYRDPASVTRFDHLDFVFVNVPGDVLPPPVVRLSSFSQGKVDPQARLVLRGDVVSLDTAGGGTGH